MKSQLRRRIAHLFLEEENENIDLQDLFDKFSSRCFKTKEELNLKKRNIWAVESHFAIEIPLPLSGTKAFTK